MANALDTLTAKLTAFSTFQEMLDTHPSYRPTIYTTDNDHLALALAYNAAQAARGDRRRAFTGHTFPTVGDRVACHRQNAWRNARIERVGPKWVTVSYVTKGWLAWQREREGRVAPRCETRIKLADIRTSIRTADGGPRRWKEG